MRRDAPALHLPCRLTFGDNGTARTTSSRSWCTKHEACLSNGERNPNPEKPESPLIEARIPHRLLRVAEVVDRRWRRTPRLRQYPVPGRTRRRAPAPRRQALSPRGTMEPPSPIVVLRIPRWPPIVARTTLSEVTGPAWIARAGVSGPTRTGTTGHEPTRTTRSRAAGRTPAGTNAISAGTTLRPGCARGRFRVGSTGCQPDGRCSERATHRGSS